MSSWMKSDTSLSSKFGIKAIIFGDFKQFPSNFRKWKSLWLVFLSDNAAFARTCNGRVFDVASDFSIEGFFGPLYLWNFWIGKSSDGSEYSSVLVLNSKALKGFSTVSWSCVIITAILWVCFSKFGEEI